MPDSKHMRWVDDYATDAKPKADWKRSGRTDRQSFLRRLSQVPGVYVPSMYEVTYDQADEGEIGHGNQGEADEEGQATR